MSIIRFKKRYTILHVGFYFLILLKTQAQDVKALNDQNRSLSWKETIDYYQKLDNQFSNAKLMIAGGTDIGRPLHLFVISSDGRFDPKEARKKNKSVILINNGIHPGEPDGIDACVRLATKLLTGKLKLPDNIVVCIVPVFNVDGLINGNCCTRANQNGPEYQGFRGNSRNLDLNRDFVKCDSENARSLESIFATWNPDVFVDTHVSDGADYQYIMTLISTQHDKLGGPAGQFINTQMTPALFKMMQDSGYQISPYVNSRKYDAPPDSGIYGFLETPRFASGYAALFGTLSFVTETHMLKAFSIRTDATEQLLSAFIRFTSENSSAIQTVRNETNKLSQSKHYFELNWRPDTSSFKLIPFAGYQAEYHISPVTNQQQLYYNREKPFVKNIRFYDTYIASDSILAPQYYVLPQAWHEIIDRMKINQVEMSRFNKDTLLDVETYVIDDFQTAKNPYEGHYLHSAVKLHSEKKQIVYRKGDYLIPVTQRSARYIVETLEPQGSDSWFNWGFFDSILQQKEWFSDYVFDGMAEKLLNNDEQLRSAFAAKKANDPAFANNASDQLYFIYTHSPYFEDLKRYPVGRLGLKPSN